MIYTYFMDVKLQMNFVEVVSGRI